MSDIVAWLRERSTVFHLAYIGHELREAADEIERLRAELAAAKRDAERYRWLRGDCPDHSIRWAQWEVRTWLAPQWTSDLRFTHLDVAIDAAMKGDR